MIDGDLLYVWTDSGLEIFLVNCQSHLKIVNADLSVVRKKICFVTITYFWYLLLIWLTCVILYLLYLYWLINNDNTFHGQEIFSDIIT